MGIDIDLWRARIGLFNGGRSRSRGGQPKTQDDIDLSNIRLRKCQQSTDNSEPTLADNNVCHEQSKAECTSTKTSKTSIPTASSCGTSGLEDHLYLVMVMFCLCYCCYKVEPAPLENPRLSYIQRWTKSAVSIIVFIVKAVFLSLLLIMAGDVELNPGPQGSNTIKDSQTSANAKQVDLPGLVQKFQLKEEFLSTEVDQKLIFKVSRDLDCWEMFARAAGISEPEVVAIERDGKDENDRRYRTLYLWHNKKVHLATYKLLLETLLEIDRAILAQEVCKMQGGDTCGMAAELVCSQGSGLVEQTSSGELTTIKHTTGENVSVHAIDTDESIEPLVLSCTLKRTLSNLGVSGLSEMKMKEVGQKLWLESSELSCKFDKICTALYMSLKKKDDAKEDLTACLLSIDTLQPVSKTSNQPVFEEQKQKLFEAKSLMEIWYIICYYRSYYNYYLIEHITEFLGSDEDKQRMSSYKQAFADYAKRRVYECPKEFGYENQDDCTMIVKLDKSYDNCTLEQLKLFEKKLCDVLELSPNGVLRLCTVDQGCYELTFQAPSFIQESVFPLSAQQEAALKALGVVWLLCGDYEFSSEQNNGAGDSGGDEDDHPDDASQRTTLIERMEAVLQRPKKSPGSISDSGLGTSSVIHTETKSLISDDCEEMFDIEVLQTQDEQPSYVSSQLNVAAYNGNLTVVRSCIEIFHHNPLRPNNQGNTPLHVAADGGHLDIVRYLVEERDINPATKSASGRTALHIAALNGNLHLVQYFVEVRNVDPMLQDKQLKTPLHDACRNGDKDVVNYIISQAQEHDEINTIVHDTSKLGTTMLHFASSSGNCPLVQLLITEFELDPNMPGQVRATPLHVAAQEGHLSVVQYLANLESCDVFCTIQKYEQNALHFAASRGHLEIVKFLILKKKLDPTAKDSSANTPLHLASVGGHLEVIQFFIEDCECDLLCLNKKRLTPLHIAATEGHINIIKYFTVQRKVDPLCKSINSISPLHLAIKAGKSKVVTFYLEDLKCNLNSPDRLGERLLFKAVHCGHLDSTKKLTNKQKWTKKKTGFRQNQLLLEAVTQGHLDILKYFTLEKSWMSFSNQIILFHAAARFGHLDIVKFFVSKLKVNPSCSDFSNATSLHRACEGGHLDVLQYLIEECKVDKTPLALTGFTPLHFAAVEGRCQVVQSLTQTYGVDPLQGDAEGDTPFHFAALYGKLDVVEFFVRELKLPANLTDSNGITPLHLACCGGYTDVVAFLLRQPECKETLLDTSHRTPLMFAVHFGRLDVVKLIIAQRKCELMVRDDRNSTILHLAAISGQLHIVKHLVSEGLIDPNVTGNSRRTPLMDACRKGHKDIVTYLLDDCKCKITSDVNGLTPLDYAQAYGHIDVADILIYCEADVYEKTALHQANLHAAARSGDLGVVKYLVTHLKVDPNTPAENGMTPLHIACAVGHAEVVNYLTPKDGQPPHLLVDTSKRTPLHYAAIGGHLHIAKLLVNMKLHDPVCRDADGDIPIHDAVTGGHLDLVEYFVSEALVNVNVHNGIGRTPLHLACMHGFEKIVRYIINIPECDRACIDNVGCTPIHHAVVEGHLNIVKILTSDKNCDPKQADFEGITPLHRAARKGFDKIVRFLINRMKCDPVPRDKNGLTPLYYATGSSHLRTVKLLISTVKRSNADPIMPPSLLGETPLHLACLSGHMDIIKCLLRARKCSIDSYINTLGRTPLHNAVSSGKLEAVMYICQLSPKSVLFKDHEGKTPLHLAAYKGHIDIVKYFVSELSINPNIKDSNQATPLFLALQEGHRDIHDFLLSQNSRFLSISELNDCQLVGAIESGELDTVKSLLTNKRLDPMYKDDFGSTPLHKATGFGHLEIVKFLVDNLKCDPHTPNKYGQTPLHIAAMEGRGKIVEFLSLEKKCDPQCKDALDNTPLHYAVKRGHLDVLRFFICKLKVDSLVRGDRDRTLLHEAADVGCLEVWKFLFPQLCKRNSNPIEIRDAEVLTPLDLACIGGNINIVGQIFADGYSPNHLPCDSIKRTPLHFAAEKGHLDIVKLLTLEKRYNPMCKDSDGDTPLHYAADSERRVVFSFYIRQLKCNPRTPNVSGITPLMILSSRKPVRLVGQQALHEAAEQGDIPAINRLIGEKTNPNCLDNLKRTPLHYAAMCGKLEAVEALLQAGASLIAEDVFHNLPLHYAAALSRLNVVKLLVCRDRDNVSNCCCTLIARGVLNMNPLQMAVASRRHIVIQFLTDQTH